jgi:hypothetical protein
MSAAGGAWIGESGIGAAAGAADICVGSGDRRGPAGTARAAALIPGT